MILFIFALQKCALNDTCLILWLAQWAPPTVIAGLKDAESIMHAPPLHAPLHIYALHMLCLATIIQPHIVYESHTGMQNAIGIREVIKFTVLNYSAIGQSIYIVYIVQLTNQTQFVCFWKHFWII